MIAKIRRVVEILMVISLGTIVSSLVNIIGCASMPERSDPALTRLVDKFIVDSGADRKRALNTKIIFMSLEGNTVGKCNPFSNVITIDPTYWFSWSTALERKALIYHEYVHCSCFLFVHENKMLEDGCSSSIMNETLPDDTCIDAHEEEYMKDLRELCK